MKLSRQNKLKQFWTKYKLTARLKVLAVVCCFVLFVTPLRNAFIPWWPYMLRDLSTFKVIRILLADMVYYVDRSPYQGSCDFVHARLSLVRMPKLEEMPVYDINDWMKRVSELRSVLSDDHLATLDNFKPALTPEEQRMLIFTVLSATQALAAFNITYFIAEGSLIGIWRHHGMIPWDDDADLLFDSEKWPLAKQVLSCLPDLELSMAPDLMWKLYHKKAHLWLGDPQIRFPFIDLFMYKNDTEHIWPLCIWMMKSFVMPVNWVLPVGTGVYEGYTVSIPKQPENILRHQFGNVALDCESRTFLRRERLLLPVNKRMHIPCLMMKEIYPFVVRNKVDKARGIVVEERMLQSRVLSTFNRTYFDGLD